MAGLHLIKDIMLVHESVAGLMKLIGENDVRLVGGAVRDSLLGLDVFDYDLATKLEPTLCVERLSACGLKPLTMAIEHGTVRVIYNGLDIQITSLREDIKTDGRRAVVQFSSDWKQDAQRRDFTINALYADVNGIIEDPLGLGLNDLKSRKVVFIGDPKVRIEEDYLRILRFFRFSSRFAANLDHSGLRACEQLADKLSFLSKERIQKELLTIVNGPNVAETLLAMNSIKLFEHMTGRALDPQIIDFLKNCETKVIWPDVKAMDGAALLSIFAGRALPLNPEDSQWLGSAFRLSRAQLKHLKLVNDSQLWSGLNQLCQIKGEDERLKLARALIYGFGYNVVLEAFEFFCLLNGSPPLIKFEIQSLQTWIPPKFNLDKLTFAKIRSLRGRALGEALKDAEAQWVACDFDLKFMTDLTSGK